MEGYNVTIAKASKELTHKERVRMKDTTNALSLDEVTQDGPVLIDLDFYSVLNVHNEKSESIDYTVHDDYRQHYEHRMNEPMTLVDCPFFTTTLYDLTEPMDLDYSDLDSFVILIGVGGKGTVTDSEGNTTSLNAGETILVPATEGVMHVEGTLKFLESYV